MLRKIVIVSIYRENLGGGEARIVFELARHLAARYEVAVVCPGERTELRRGSDGLWMLTVESAGSEEVWFPLLTRGARERFFELLDGFDPDVVHAHDPVMLGIVALVWARTRGVPFVTTPHFIPDRILEFPSGERALLVVFSLIQPLVTAYLTSYFAHCDAIIALNTAVVEGTRRFAGHGPLVTIPNGRDLGPLAKCRIARMDGEARTLCFVGYLAERKNQMYLLRALALLPRTWRLLLVGKSLVPTYERALHEFVSQNGLANVEFLGAVDYDRIPAVLEQAHLLVSASVLEAQSLVIIEALASGTPVVGLSNETVDELVDDEVGRRVAKDAPPAEFAERVKEICALPGEQYEDMARRARARVSHLDWPPVVDATVSLYERLAASPRRVPAGAPLRPRQCMSRPARLFAAGTNLICTLLYRTRRPRR